LLVGAAVVAGIDDDGGYWARAGKGACLGVAVVLVSEWEKGEGERRAESTSRVQALSCPGRVHARSGAFWASWARSGLGNVGLFFDQGEYRGAQGSEACLLDMVS
jgi:hypothetical protein